MEATQNEEEGRVHIDYALAFTYIFKDSDWIKKVLIGGIMFAFSFLIVPGLFLVGYFIRAIRRVGAGDKYGLPEWNEWGELAATGFKFGLAVALYLLPTALVFGAFLALIFVPSAISESQDGLLAASVAALMIIIQAVFLVVGLALSFWLPAIEIRFASTGMIRSCFQFKELYEFMRSNIKDYFLVFLILFGVNYLAGLGMILFFVGILFTAFYAWMVGAHLKGQLLANSLKRM